MEVLADSVSVSKNAFLRSSMVPSYFFHRTEESRAALSHSGFPLLPPSPLASSLAVGFKVPAPTPWEEGVVGQKSNYHGRRKQRKCPSSWLSLPSPFISSRLTPWTSLPSFRGAFSLGSSFQENKVVLFLLILCTMSLLLWTSHLSQRFEQTNSGQTRHWDHGHIYYEIEQIKECHRSQHSEHETCRTGQSLTRDTHVSFPFYFSFSRNHEKFSCDHISYQNRWAYCLSWRKKK